MRTRPLALVAALQVACAADPSEAPLALLVPAALAVTPAARDPLVEHRPAQVACPDAAFGPEGGGFEIQTGVCSYGAFDHAVGVELEPGDTLEISVWHDTLDAVEPAEGHAAIWLGSRVVWEQTFAIPSPSAAYDAEVVLDEGVAADAPLGLHLHNHGFNSWRFIRVDRSGYAASDTPR